MRRILLLGLLASLLMAPAAFAASINQVVRDCADDGVLEGHYSVAQLREALRRLPTDVAEYTSCTDVLSRAIDAAAVRAGTVHSSNARTGGPAAPGNVQAAAAAAPAAPANVSATTPQDAAALRAAAQARPPRLAGGSPGVVRLTAAVGRNSLPSSVLVVLILLGAAAVAVALPGARRVIRRHRR